MIRRSRVGRREGKYKVVETSAQCVWRLDKIGNAIQYLYRVWVTHQLAIIPQASILHDAR